MLWQNRKFWAKNDELLLDEVMDQSLSKDPFKTMYVPKPGKKTFAEKITDSIPKGYRQSEPLHLKGFPSGMGKYGKKKWTEVENSL